MKLSPREVAMGLATQAESLPKLRDKLLGIVNEINLVLNEGRNKRSAFMGTGKEVTRKTAVTRKKKQPKAKFLDRMPDNAVSVKGLHSDYRFSPGLGLLSTVKEGRIRLLRVPHKKSSWCVKDPKGNRLFIGRDSLQVRVGMELGV